MVPGFQIFSDPDILISGELRDILEGRTTTPVDLPAVLAHFASHGLATGLVSGACPLDVDIAEAFPFGSHGGVGPGGQVVEVFDLGPGAAVVLWEKLLVIYLSPEVLPALVSMLSGCNVLLVYIAECSLFTETITNSSIPRHRQTNISSQHELMVTLDAF